MDIPNKSNIQPTIIKGRSYKLFYLADDHTNSVF